VVGVFVVGAFVLLIVGVVALGSGRFFVKTFPFVCYFDDVNGLSLGSPVKFKGVEVGAVTRIFLRLDQPPDDFHIPVVIELDAEKVQKAGVDVSIFEPEEFKRRVKNGLRAQLQSQSLVTGLLFVQIDYFPDTVPRFVGAGEHYLEIPTVPTPLEELQGTLKQFVVKLNQLNLSALVDSATGAFDSAQHLLSAPETKDAIVSLDKALVNFNKLTVAVTGKVDPLSQGVVGAADKLQAAAAEIEQTAKTLRTLIEPGSPVEVKLRQTLDDVSAAARSVRLLADALERDPSSLVRGKDYEPRKP
jgi:paraquat-inducible protein B